MEGDINQSKEEEGEEATEQSKEIEKDVALKGAQIVSSLKEEYTKGTGQRGRKYDLYLHKSSSNAY
jgi:hypothetical protein